MAQIPYDVEILIQPPSAIAPNKAISPAVVIAVKVSSTYDRPPNEGPRREADGVWAHATLLSWNENGDLVRATNRLGGIEASSIHPAPGRPNMADPTIGYAIFRNLSVSQPGQYLIRIVLISMDSEGSLYGEQRQGGRVLQGVTTRVFRVDPRAGVRSMSSYRMCTI